MEQINDLEDRVTESNQAEQKREKRIMQNENRPKELNDSIRSNNIHIIGVPEEEEREKGAENLFQEIIEDFPNVGKETDIHIQEAQRTPIKINKSRPTPRYYHNKIYKIQR